ncbi:hypothetical protein LQ938_05750 [Microbacterium sp. cx-55]|uniref:hypothetical protein n=1 Tax=unclassified Microbacterium TaxID=2609290 RepID=UPI001CBAE772|nr:MULTISPECIES: hypothetical protein [unclassified Microbacterium]MBZ4486757.1 hypothetical protein [Microbacterium sp. cx-55]MCC4907734.1 hypothetical protein [Microbacterium sp. cx-59]UGB36286.1 hypothetical protein LQ938_05750 [Microbacterium sp. cx-55]
MMIWHGTADALLSENETVRNWNEVREVAGGPITDDNSRLIELIERKALVSEIEHASRMHRAGTLDAYVVHEHPEPAMGFAAPRACPDAVLGAPSESAAHPIEGSVKHTREDLVAALSTATDPISDHWW